MKAAEQQGSKKRARSINLPKPTPDQSEYLQKIKDSTNGYDPAVVVGGPRRARA